MSDSADLIIVRSITVRTGRIVCEVEVPDPANRFVTDKLADAILQARPHIARHACVSGGSKLFGETIRATSTPHLLEHLAIDVQTQRSLDPDAVFVGTTEWTDEKRGLARIELSFVDDIEALGSFTEAHKIINDTMLFFVHG